MVEKRDHVVEGANHQISCHQPQHDGAQELQCRPLRTKGKFAFVSTTKISIVMMMASLLMLSTLCSSFTTIPSISFSTLKTTSSNKMTTNLNERRKKKNKYANFSKADKLTKDPFEELVSESEEKKKKMQVENLKKQNKPIPLDEETEREMREEKRERNKTEFPDTRTIDPYDPTTYGFTELGTVLGAHGVHGLVKIAAVTEFSERLTKPGIRHIKAPNRRSPREIKLLDGREIAGDEYLVKFQDVGDRDAANKLRGCLIFAKQSERPADIAEDEYLVSELVGLDVYIEDGFEEEEYEDDDEYMMEYDDEEEEDDGNGEDNSMDDEDNDEEFAIIQDSSSTKKHTKALGGAFVGTIGGIVLAEEMCSIPGLGQDLLEVVLPRGRTGSPSWRDEMVLIPMVPQIVPRVDLKGNAVYITPPRGLLDLSYVREEKVRIRGFLPPAKDDEGEK